MSWGWPARSCCSRIGDEGDLRLIGSHSRKSRGHGHVGILREFRRRLGCVRTEELAGLAEFVEVAERLGGGTEPSGRGFRDPVFDRLESQAAGCGERLDASERAGLDVDLGHLRNGDALQGRQNVGVGKGRDRRDDQISTALEGGRSPCDDALAAGRFGDHLRGDIRQLGGISDEPGSLRRVDQIGSAAGCYRHDLDGRTGEQSGRGSGDRPPADEGEPQ